MLNFPESTQIQTLKVPQVNLYPHSRISTNVSSTPSFQFAVKNILSNRVPENVQLLSQDRSEGPFTGSNIKSNEKSGNTHGTSVTIKLPKLEDKVQFFVVQNPNLEDNNFSNGFLKLEEISEQEISNFEKVSKNVRNVSIEEYCKSDSEFGWPVESQQVSRIGANENLNQHNPSTRVRNTIKKVDLGVFGINNLVLPQIKTKKPNVSRFEIVLNKSALKMPRIKKTVKDCCWAFCF